MAGGSNSHANARTLVNRLMGQQAGFADPVRLWMHLRPQWRALDNLDAGAPGVGDVGDGVAARRIGAGRLVEFDAFRLDLLHEGGVVLHVETDVVEHTPSR